MNKIKKSSDLKKLLSEPLVLVAIILILVFLLIFIIYPLVSILSTSLIDNEAKFTTTAYVKALTDRSFLSSLKNTLVLGVVVGLLSVGIGFLFAYAKVYLKSHFQKLFSLISILPIVSPPFVLALSAIMLFGRSGLVTKHLLGISNANVFGFTGLVVVQTMTFFPVAFLSLVGQLNKIDPALEDAAQNLGAGKLHSFFTVTLPLMAPGLANAFLIAFIEVIADFSNPMLIGGDYGTLATSIYMKAVGNYDTSTGAAMATVLLVFSLALFLLSKFFIERRSYVTVTGKSAKDRLLITDKKIVWPIDIVCLIITLIVVGFYVFVPLGGFFKLIGVDYSLTLDHFKYVFTNGREAIFDTLYLAFIATPITGILAMIIAFLVVRKKFIGKTFMEASSMLAMAVPGTVLGLGYSIAFNKKPILIAGTALILILAFVVRSLPAGVRSGIASLSQIDPAIEESARNLGAGSGKVFTSVTLPLIRSAFLSGLVFAFVRSMTAVSAVVFLVTPKHKLITSSIMAQVDGGRFGVACAYSTVLIIVVLICIALINFILRLFSGSSDSQSMSL